MKQIRYLRYLLTILSIITLFVVAGCDNQNASTGDKAQKPSKTAQTEMAAAPNEDKTVSAAKTQTEITVYFPDANAEKLIAAKRQITDSSDKYAQAVNALIAGPANEAEGIGIMPKGAKVLNVTVKDATATVDFSKEFQTNFTGGSTGEIMLVGSIVDTLTEFPEIKAVRFTLEGQPLDILGGHLDLTEPVSRMNDLL